MKIKQLKNKKYALNGNNIYSDLSQAKSANILSPCTLHSLCCWLAIKKYTLSMPFFSFYSFCLLFIYFQIEIKFKLISFYFLWLTSLPVDHRAIFVVFFWGNEGLARPDDDTTRAEITRCSHLAVSFGSAICAQPLSHLASLSPAAPQEPLY